MPQEMNVIRCYKCRMFQVHIVKKAKKWKCKLCNEKQSLQRVYFQGSGKLCRFQVQHLNTFNQLIADAQASVGQNDLFDDNSEEDQDCSEIPVAQGEKRKFKDSFERESIESYKRMCTNIDDGANDDNVTKECCSNVNDGHYDNTRDDTYGRDKHILMVKPNECVEQTEANESRKEHCDDSKDGTENKATDLGGSIDVKEIKSIFESNDDIDTVLDF